MNYLNSTDINVFPSANRPTYPQSRLTSEQNLINIINSLTSSTNRSFVITDTFSEDDPFEFVINGYYFKVDQGSKITGLFSGAGIGAKIYGKIQTRTLQGETLSFTELQPTNNTPQQNEDRVTEISQISDSKTIPSTTLSKTVSVTVHVVNAGTELDPHYEMETTDISIDSDSQTIIDNKSNQYMFTVNNKIYSIGYSNVQIGETNYSVTVTFTETDMMTQLDVNSDFVGVEFTDTITTGDDDQSTTVHYLHLLEYDGTNWAIPPESTIKFSTNQSCRNISIDDGDLDE